MGTAELLSCGRQTKISHLRGPDSAEKKGRQVLKFVPMARLQSPGQVKPGETCCHLCKPQPPWQLGSTGIHPRGFSPQGIVQSVCVLFLGQYRSVNGRVVRNVCKGFGVDQ